MSKKIVPQNGAEVKCSVDFCHEPVFRDGLCWDCFKEEMTRQLDAQDAERQASLEGMGYVFEGPALDDSWFGYSLKEVYG